MTLRAALTGTLVSIGVLLSVPPGSCQDLPEGTEIVSTQEEYVIADPFVQRLLYKWTEDCLGQKGDVDGVEWRVANAIYNVTRRHFNLGVYFSNLKGRRVIILTTRTLFDPQTITHEAIHDILRVSDPIPEHVREKCEYGYKGG